MGTSFPVAAACLVMGLSVTSVAQVPQPSGPLRIVDSTGKNMGAMTPVLGGSHGLEGVAIMTVGALRFPVLVAQSELFDIDATGGQEVYFAANNCQGQPYILTRLPTPGLLDTVAIIGSRFSLYAAVVGGAPATRTFGSGLDTFGNCVVQAQTLNSINATHVLDLLDYFTPPYSLQAAPATASVPMLGGSEVTILSLLVALAYWVARARRYAPQRRGPQSG